MMRKRKRQKQFSGCNQIYRWTESKAAVPRLGRTPMVCTICAFVSSVRSAPDFSCSAKMESTSAALPLSDGSATFKHTNPT